MRYAAIFVFALSAACSTLGQRAWGVDVDVGVGVAVGGGHDSVFFEAQLAPHGTWIDLPEYGRVWQPGVVVTDREWRPYLNNGHWVWTDAGWYWESDYSWGWAAFHYGRWNYVDRYNWVWSPDSVWGPAWVSWRHSDSYYGWAPLPYGTRFEGGVFVGGNFDIGVNFFSFVPSHSFLSVNLNTFSIPRTQAGAIYRETKIVNNSYVYNDNRVINNGIPVAQVAAATKQEIKAKAIADAKAPTEKGEAGKIAAYRPDFKKSKENKAGDAKPAGDKTKAEVPAAFKTTEKTGDAKTEDAKTKPNPVKSSDPKSDRYEGKDEVKRDSGRIDTPRNEPKREEVKREQPGRNESPKNESKSDEVKKEQGREDDQRDDSPRDEAKRDQPQRDEPQRNEGKHNEGKSEKSKSDDNKR